MPDPTPPDRYPGRCRSINPATGRRCILVGGHRSGCHRWWVTTKASVNWNDGKRREEWEG